MKHGYNSKAWNTCNNGYTLMHLPCMPTNEDSFILNHLITSRMEYIALCASFFLKNELISERKSVTLCKGIGLSNVLICNYKITHFLRYAEIPVPLLYPKKKVIYYLAKLE